MLGLFIKMSCNCSVIEQVKNDGRTSEWTVEQWKHRCLSGIALPQVEHIENSFDIVLGSATIRFALYKLDGVLGTCKFFNRAMMSVIQLAESRCFRLRRIRLVAMSFSVMSSRLTSSIGGEGVQSWRSFRAAWTSVSLKRWHRRLEKKGVNYASQDLFICNCYWWSVWKEKARQRRKENDRILQVCSAIKCIRYIHWVGDVDINIRSLIGTVWMYICLRQSQTYQRKDDEGIQARIDQSHLIQSPHSLVCSLAISSICCVSNSYLQASDRRPIKCVTNDLFLFSSSRKQY